MTIAVVVLTLGRPDLLAACLRQLAHALLRTETQCIVIDNGPEADREGTRRATEGVAGLKMQLEVPPANLGVLRSLARAEELAEAEVLAAFHPDTRVWERGWDQIAVEAFQADPKLGLAGLVGAATLQADGSWHDVCARLTGPGDPPGTRTLIGAWTPDGGRPVAVVDGCGMFYRRSTMHLLDTRYPGLHHWYDKEASCAWLAAGWRVRALPIRFDHGTTEQAVTARVEAYQENARRVATAARMAGAAQGVPPDHLMYVLNGSYWRAKWGRYLPVTVTAASEVRWMSEP